jgi:hypothetical protein
MIEKHKHPSWLTFRPVYSHNVGLALDRRLGANGVIITNAGAQTQQLMTPLMLTRCRPVLLRISVCVRVLSRRSRQSDCDVDR